MTGAELKKLAFDKIDALAEKIISIGDTVWKNPEPGYREYKTARLAAETFRSLGLTTREGLGITGLRADLESGNPDGPTIAVLGEMDSLILPDHPQCDPESGAVHSCGHNANFAGMLGAAMVLTDPEIAKELTGRIAFFAVPAEECIEIDKRLAMMDEKKISALGGKAELIRCGAFDDVDLAFMLHASSEYGFGAHNGFITKRVNFIGRSCHAARPSGGINALSAVTVAQCAIGVLRERWADLNQTVRIHGVITNGGDVVNIIPNRASMEFLIRADKLETLVKLNREFDRAVRGAAGSVGAGVEIRTIAGYMPQYDDPLLEDLYCDEVMLLKNTEKRPAGFFHASSTDMGDLSTIMPTLHGYVSGAAGTSHGIDYYIADPVRAYVNNAKIAAAIAIDLLADGAEKARLIASRREGKLSIEEYIRITDSFNSLVRTDPAEA